MFDSLRSRLALTNLAITLVALLVLTVVFAQLLRQHSVDIERSGVGQQAAQLKTDVNRELRLIRRSIGHRRQVGLGQLEAFITHDGDVLDKRVILYAANGSCAYDSAATHLSSATAPCTPGVDYHTLLVGPIGKVRSASRFVKVGNKTYLLWQRSTIGARPHEKTAVVLVTDASAVTPDWTTIAPAFLLAALAAAIVWLAMAIYFAYAVSRPLGRITEAAGAMAAGDYSQRVQVRQVGEIGELATSFNHMATQVATSHQLLKDFVANVSHDLRTPLTLISGYVGTILDGTAQSPQEVRRAAEVISEEAGRMERLVDDLLQLTRLESGLRKFLPEPVSVFDLVDKTVRRISAAMNGRAVENQVSHDLPLAMVDEELLERVLMNLLNNALEHTPPDGKVRVEAVNAGPWIQIVVSDTGSGIALEDQGRIFERFYRADRSRSRDSGHSGLGLPIVKEIIESHGGRVDVESRPGQGSSFTFTVPSYAQA